MKRAIIVAAAVLLVTAARSAELPWFERYFFPIGMWCIPTNDEEDWLDDDGGTGKTIAYWDPQDYYSMIDLNSNVESYLQVNIMTRTVYTCFYREKRL